MGKAFAEYIKKLRLDRKLSLRDVEAMAEISNAYLSQLESGERGLPTVKIMEKLSKAYGVGVSELMKVAESDMKRKKTPNPILQPDWDFIFRGYEDLNEEGKGKLKDYLAYLRTLTKEKKK